MKLKVHAQDGKQVGEVELSDAMFGGRVNTALLHQVLTMYAANQRQGTAKAKGRSEVSGGGAKPFKQKGTGNARAGSNTSPVWVRGSKAFGPRPRDYWARIPRSMRLLALQNAVAARAQESRLMVVDGLKCDPAKTKTMASMVKALSLDGVRTLLVTDGLDQTVFRCGRNIKNLSIVPFSALNAALVVNSDTLVLAAKGLVGRLEEAVSK